MATAVAAIESSKAKTITLWVLRVLAAVAFLSAGGAKLTGAPMMVAMFTKIGFGQGFRYLTGALEVSGAIALFIPRFTPHAALMLAAIMASAIGFHLTILGGNPAGPIFLLLLTSTIAWLSWKKA